MEYKIKMDKNENISSVTKLKSQDLEKIMKFLNINDTKDISLNLQNKKIYTTHHKNYLR